MTVCIFGICLFSRSGGALAHPGGPDAAIEMGWLGAAAHPGTRDSALSTRGIDYALEATPEDLSERFSPEQLALLETLNRVDVANMSRLDELVVPRRWDAEPLEYSPLPREIPLLAPVARALVVHQPLQVFAAYEDGRMVRWGPVSTGRADRPTPSGRFHLNWRSRGRASTVNPEWYMEWYFNFQNERGLSFHEYALPGEPASHACVRLLERDARWIYEWGEGWILDERGWEVLEEGTPVWIVGEYAFGEPPPWLDPASPHPDLPLQSLVLEPME